MGTSGANGLSVEQDREINALLDGNLLSVESMALLQQVLASSDPIECDKVLDHINDSLVDFALKVSSPLMLELSGKSLTRISPQLMAFLQKNNSTIMQIDFSNNALQSLDKMFVLELPRLESLILANNPLSKSETEQVMTSFPHAKVITDVEPEVVLSTPKRNKLHTPHFAKTQADAARTIDAKVDEPKKEGFFKKLFKRF
jgi:Leucine-rich repeat (LRR) protein